MFIPFSIAEESPLVSGHGSKDYHLSGATITTDADGICREHRLDESVEVARPKDVLRSEIPQMVVLSSCL